MPRRRGTSSTAATATAALKSRRCTDRLSMHKVGTAEDQGGAQPFRRFFEGSAGAVAHGRAEDCFEMRIINRACAASDQCGRKADAAGRRVGAEPGVFGVLVPIRRQAAEEGHAELG